MDEMIIAYLVMGPMMLIFSLIFKRFPPKKINNYYGYRTTSSMKSQETWDFANAHSPNLMIYASLITIFFQAIFMLTLDEGVDVMASTGVLVVSLICTIPLTERQLKKHFDKEGKRKTEVD